jgi:hypothetical protein
MAERGQDGIIRALGFEAPGMFRQLSCVPSHRAERRVNKLVPHFTGQTPQH